jgi:hypothetical protein
MIRGNEQANEEQSKKGKGRCTCSLLPLIFVIDCFGVGRVKDACPDPVWAGISLLP